jgi:hypothetical protein
MRSIIVFIPLALAAGAQAKEMTVKYTTDALDSIRGGFSDELAEQFTDRLVDGMFSRAPMALHLRDADLDSTTLGKTGKLLMSQRVASSAPPSSSLVLRPAAQVLSDAQHPIRGQVPQIPAQPQLLRMGRREALSSFLGAALLVGTPLAPPPAFAASSIPSDIGLSDLSSKIVDCAPGQYLPRNGRWECLEISAVATSGKTVSGAGVYGRIRDANDNLCLSAGLDEGMKASIASLGGLPKGDTPVKFVVVIYANAPRPLKFEGFHATYTNAAIEKQFAPFDPCELDPLSCELDNAA